MAKPRQMKALTSYDQIFDRFTKGELLKTDYGFLASMFREFKIGIVYTILKAKINSTIQKHLRNPKQSSESQKDIGRLEGLDAVLLLIDEMSEMDREIKREMEEPEDEKISLDQEPNISHTDVSISSPD